MDLLDSAWGAAEAAARFLRGLEPPSPAQWTVKGRNDFVTDADRQAEEIIRARLLTDHPGSSVLGEEFGQSGAGAGLVWIVDPLDGTTNFLHGYPAAAVSIAAAVDGVLEAGVVLRLSPPVSYRAARGRGATRDGRPLAVSRISDPAHALVGTGFPFKHPEQLERYQQQFARIMAATSGIRRAGSAALDLADVAAGHFDGFWELSLAPWDVAAGILLVREAGGVVTDLDGRPRDLGHGPVVAGNPAIHAWLLTQLDS